LSMTPNRSPIDNGSRYNPTSTLAPGIDPYGRFPQDPKPEVAASTMQTYPPPQMVPYKGPQPAQMSGYAAFVTSGQTYPNQTYPGLQQPPKPHNGYVNGLQIPTPRDFSHSSSPRLLPPAILTANQLGTWTLSSRVLSGVPAALGIDNTAHQTTRRSYPPSRARLFRGLTTAPSDPAGELQITTRSILLTSLPHTRLHILGNRHGGFLQ